MTNSKKKKDDSSKPQKLKRKAYERELQRLQVELCKLQSWIKRTGTRAVVVFEGRDAAGKGGVIKRITERVSPRVFKVAALPTPSDREKSQLYMQRYVAQMPAAGEVVLFDRSWYNRAGIERVLGFCTTPQYERFLRYCSLLERVIVDEGIVLIKYWLSVSYEEQVRRFHARIDDPMRQWKLSTTDLESVRRWYDYSRARDSMFLATDTDFAPWHIVKSDNKRTARLNCIAHLISQFDYDEIPREKVKIPERDQSSAYNDEEAIATRRFVPNKYE